jgi:MoxR-like ATPase
MPTTTRKRKPARITSGCWSEVQDALESGCTHVILFGPPGTGKTFAALNMGLLPDQQSHRLQCTEDLSPGQIVGHPMPVGDEWRWVTGPGMLAWAGNGVIGDRLNVDEGNRVSGDGESTLLGILDSVESCKWRHPITGEIHRPNPGFSAVLTTNLEHMRDLPTALADRFPIQIRINVPHPDALAMLPEDLRGPAAAAADAPAHRRFSLRTFMTYAELRTKLGQERAARLCFRDQANSILDALRVEGL